MSGLCVGQRMKQRKISHAVSEVRLAIADLRNELRKGKHDESDDGK